MEHVNVRFGDVNAHFTVRFPIGFSRAPSPRRGSMPTEPGLALNTGCLGRDPVMCLGRRPAARAPRLLAIEHACTAPEPCARLMVAAARAPGCRSPPSKRTRVRSSLSCRSLMGRDRHRPPGAVHVPGHIRAEDIECSRDGLCRCLNVLARPVRRSSGRDTTPPIPARRVSSRRRDFPSPSASPATQTPEIGRTLPLPRRASTLACTTNEAR
jgi:hypothetical protein